MKPCILITGGTGLVGQALTTALLAKGYEVIIMSRQTINPPKPTPGLSYATWDPARGQADTTAFAKADHIINLAGAGVADKRWSNSRKKLILDSRISSCQLIVSMLEKNKNKTQSVISSSAIGWYGPDPANSKTRDEGFTEDATSMNDFLGNTCVAWEQSIKGVEALGVRLAILRTGIVLSPKGGALKEFMKPMRFKVAAVLGNGKQVISWIHIDDLVDMYIYMIENPAMAGVYNAVGPEPVTNRTLVKALARQLAPRFHITMPVPAFMLKIILGEMSIEVLKSATVSARKIQGSGFVFKHPQITEALSHLLV